MRTRWLACTGTICPGSIPLMRIHVYYNSMHSCISFANSLQPFLGGGLIGYPTEVKSFANVY
jgi:hypothetical protein